MFGTSFHFLFLTASSVQRILHSHYILRGTEVRYYICLHPFTSFVFAFYRILGSYQTGCKLRIILCTSVDTTHSQVFITYTLISSCILFCTFTHFVSRFFRMFFFHATAYKATVILSMRVNAIHHVIFVICSSHTPNNFHIFIWKGDMKLLSCL